MRFATSVLAASRVSVRARVPALVLRLPTATFSASAAPRKVYESPGKVPDVPAWGQGLTDFILGDVTDKYQKSATIEAETGEISNFGRLKQRVDWMGIQYYIRGWEQNEMAAVFLPNGMPFNLTVLGAAKIGVPFTIIDPRATPTDVIHQVKDSKAIYIITSAQLLPVVHQAWPAIRGLKEILILDKADDPADLVPRDPKDKKKHFRFSIEMKYNLLFPKPPGWGALPDWTVSPETVFCIHYGPAVRGAKPKGIIVTHGQMVKNIYQAEQMMKDLTDEDVLMSCVSYFNLDAFTLINNLAIYKGVRNVTLGDPTPEKFIEAVKKYGVTIARVDPTFLAALAKHDAAELPTLRRFISDSTPLDQEVEETIRKKYPNVSIEFSYGAPTLATMSTPGKRTQVLLPGTFAKILDEEGREVDEGQPGHLWLKGEQIPVTYHGHEEAALQRFVDGFYNTKDTAIADSEGRLTIRPRPLDPDND